MRRRTIRFGTRFAVALLAMVPLCAAEIDPATYQAHINYLASDELKGRGTGTPEIERATDYIEAQLISYGLKPVPGQSGYRQQFMVRTGAHLEGASSLTAIRDGKSETLQLNQGFIPFSFSTSGTAPASQVVFVGYGITAPEYKYDDYAGLDVKDKFVLMMRHEPQEADAQSKFAGRNTTQHATFINKAINARNHGARGVILINDTYNHPGERDSLMMFGQATGPDDAGIYFVQITADTAEQWIASAGRNLRTIINDIDADLGPRSFAIPGLTAAMTVGIVQETKPASNVLAFLPGETDEYLIIGAHYDHLGLGNEFSLAPREIGSIHHGADDNASGTAGMLELARYFAKQAQAGTKLRRGILFMAFSGEEYGLLGSNHFTKQPLLPLENAVAMINMDMIGRSKEGKLTVIGTNSGAGLLELVNSTPLPAPLKIDLTEAIGSSGSDHQSFVAKRIPVLFFFSGLHGDYHRPSDTADKIETKNAAAIVGFIADISTALATRQDRPQFQESSDNQTTGADPHSGGTPSGGGYGPNFGSVPDFDEPPTGVRFADVRKGTPADEAGLRAGDILISFDGKEIQNLYDFTYALQSHQPGDIVLVRVIRQNQTIEAKVLLTERR